jgi:hypothetical protein
MENVPGTTTASLLLSMHLPLSEVFRALMVEFDFSVDEVTAAVIEVQRRGMPGGPSGSHATGSDPHATDNSMQFAEST